MEKTTDFPFAILYGVLALIVLVYAQDQSGFISIDCGITEDSYKDEITGIHYVSDAAFIDTGVSKDISSEFKTKDLEKQYWNIRSFPEGTKNCYNITPTPGKNNKYLIRAGFMYGNYDEKGKVPEFELYLGGNWWDLVTLDDPYANITKEIIHVSSSKHLHICLVNTGFGIPFISFLEIRLLDNNTYITESGSLELYARLGFGLAENQTVRFPDDVYDRKWSSFDPGNWIQLSTFLTVNSSDHNNYHLPSRVMETAVTIPNSSILLWLSWTLDDPTSQFYIYMHFAEIEELEANQFREFNIYLNEELWYGPFVPTYLSTITIHSTSAEKGIEFTILLNETENSTLLPLMNAIEIYLVKEFSQSETNQEDVNAIMNIKSIYGVGRYWQGDPCTPELYIWEGLNCSYNGSDPPRIVSLNLSSGGLTGEISSSISGLRMLQYLDLSNNSLTGPVPDFLSQLSSLRVLNLEENGLSGFVPEKLIERSKNGTLLLSVGKNGNLCSSASCKKNKFIVPVVVSVGAIFIILCTSVVIIWRKRRIKQATNAWKVNVESNRKNGALELKDRQFPYSEVLNITNNFERIIGKGACGTVYYGCLADTQVAVKMFSLSSVQGYKQFHAEAILLMKVPHRNLTTIVGYCDEGPNQGLIYEFIANGSLKRNISDENTNFLSWQERLLIAIGAAQGLQHLHYGVKPPSIHGNLNSANILLTEKLEAKLSDFGLSIILSTADDTDVSREDISTTAYIDPEYYVSKRLNNKSDVFSFGIVLMEIITSRPVISKTSEKTHISQWISSLLEKGDIENIVDPRLEGDFHINSVWKAVDMAMACINPISTRRPTINHIVMELNDCLAIERSQKKKCHETNSKDSIEMFSLNPYDDSIPLAR